MPKSPVPRRSKLGYLLLYIYFEVWGGCHKMYIKKPDFHFSPKKGSHSFQNISRHFSFALTTKSSLLVLAVWSVGSELCYASVAIRLFKPGKSTVVSRRGQQCSPVESSPVRRPYATKTMQPAPHTRKTKKNGENFPRAFASTNHAQHLPGIQYLPRPPPP